TGRREGMGAEDAEEVTGRSLEAGEGLRGRPGLGVPRRDATPPRRGESRPCFPSRLLGLRRRDLLAAHHRAAPSGDLLAACARSEKSGAAVAGMARSREGELSPWYYSGDLGR